MIEIKKNNISANKYVKNFSVPVLSESETIVPDNKPDVLKIIDVSAEIKTFNKSINGADISAAGSVSYTIIYIPESANGISVINAVSAFNYGEEFENLSEESIVNIVPAVGHIEFAVLNSRKISVKAVIDMNFDIMGRQYLSLTDEICGDEIEISKANIKLLNRTTQKSHIININEQITTASDKATAESVIKSDAEIFGKDVKVISNKAVVKGDLIVHTLYTASDGQLCTCENILPFTEILDADGIDESGITYVDLSVADFSVSPNGAENDIKTLLVNGKIKADIYGESVNTYETINDAYSTSYKLALNMSSEETDEFCEKISVNTAVRETVAASENKISEIYMIYARPSSVAAKEIGGGKTVVKGDMNVNILYITKNPDMPLCNLKTEIPFETDMPVNDSYNLMCPCVNIERISYDFSDSEVEIKINTSTELMCFKRRKINIINSAEKEDFKDGYIPSIVLYFVQKNDTLWDIAKRYHTKTNYIEDLNDLHGEISEGKQLLIPKS